jgi:hypothetical protein
MFYLSINGAQYGQNNQLQFVNKTIKYIT